MQATQNKTSKENVQKIKILKAAEKLLAFHGYPYFTIRNIAERTGVSVGSVQHYYRTKNELLQDLLLYVTDKYNEEYGRVFSKTFDSPDDRFFGFVDFLLQDMTNPLRRGFFFQAWALAPMDEYVEKRMEESFSRYHAAVSNMVKDLNPELSKAEISKRASAIQSIIEGTQLTLVKKGRYFVHRESIRGTVREEAYGIATGVTAKSDILAYGQAALPVKTRKKIKLPNGLSSGTAILPKGKHRSEQILQKAQDVLVQEGYPNFTMRNIAAKAGIRMGNLQYYYQTKNDLLRAMFQHAIEAHSGRFMKLDSLPGIEPQNLFAKVIDYLLADLKKPHVRGLFLQIWALSMHDNYAEHCLEEIYEHYRNALSGIITRINPDLSMHECNDRAAAIQALIEGSQMSLTLIDSRLVQKRGLNKVIKERAYRIATRPGTRVREQQ